VVPAIREVHGIRGERQSSEDKFKRAELWTALQVDAGRSGKPNTNFVHMSKTAAATARKLGVRKQRNRLDRAVSAHVHEYACHEGNRPLEGMQQGMKEGKSLKEVIEELE
jgi:hypothetical protein